jgi:hypothetical protein
MQPPRRLRAAAEKVDEDGGVEENRRHLPDAALVSTPLLANPAAGILVPLVAAVGNGAERRLEQFPATIVVQRLLDRTRDIRATATSADATVELADESILEGYVHTHGHTLAH